MWAQVQPATRTDQTPRVAGLRVSGRFRLRDPLRFATTVAEILPVRMVKVGRARIELRYRR
jgi:ferric-dicitrate binding protein FerR (iron transport regulator)